MTDLSQSREKDKINPVVFYTSAGLILLFSLMTIFFRDFSAEWIGRTLDWVSKPFGWYYLLAATLYIVFVVCIACSRFGSVKLGPEQSKPEFSLLSWAAMLFAAGIGIDLMAGGGTFDMARNAARGFAVDGGLRQRHPEVTLEAAIPFAGQADHWSAADQRRRMTLLDQCDLETVVQHTYTPGCMNRRNRYMVDRSSLLIAVYDGIPQGGTLNTLSYAMGKGVRTVILPVVSPAQ